MYISKSIIDSHGEKYGQIITKMVKLQLLPLRFLRTRKAKSKIQVPILMGRYRILHIVLPVLGDPKN